MLPLFNYFCNYECIKTLLWYFIHYTPIAILFRELQQILIFALSTADAATGNSTAGTSTSLVPVFIKGTAMALLYFFIIVGIVASIGGIYATVELLRINKSKRKSR